MIQEINDSVQVVVIFKAGVMEPRKFLWHGREYPVKSVNLTYSRFEGRAKVYYFAVSDSANFFKLRFNSDDLTWALVEVIPG